MRAFNALEPSEGFVEDVAAMARMLGAAMEGRFVLRQNYHVTLAFLGDIGEAQVREAMDAMDEACADAAEVPLRPEGLGKFGRASDATLWMGLAPAPELAGLANRLREALGLRGVPFDDKPFLPHVTLARRARLPKGPLPELAFPLPSEAARITLFKSTLSRDGAQYKPLYTEELPCPRPGCCEGVAAEAEGGDSDAC